MRPLLAPAWVGHPRLGVRPRGLSWVAPVSGWMVATAGVLNIGSALTPDLPDRARVLVQWAPPELIVSAHALALPGGVALTLIGLYLGRRRPRALWTAVSLLVALGALNLLKGLDFEEALACWALAALLAAGRASFSVEHDPGGLRTALRRTLVAGSLAVLSAALAVLAASHWARPALTPGIEVRETIGLLTLTGGPQRFAAPFQWVPLGLGILGIGTLALAASGLFRPIARTRALPSGELRELAGRLVRQHGADTLSYFKLRRDVQVFAARDGRAFVAYRIQAGVLLISGDPVGARDAVPGLLGELREFAHRRGLKVGAVGASQELADLCPAAGLRAFYIGDEAIVDTAAFSVEGRRIRKVRQSVARLVRAAYSVDLRPLGEVGQHELARLEALADGWRDGKPDRGFSMAMGSLRGEHQEDSHLLVTRDAAGQVRGLLHFVPCYGRSAASLSLMCRDPATPNGLTEFMVVRAIELFRERGVSELSLNFAAFARTLHDPRTRTDRLLRRFLALAEPFFQIESLYAFNAKFRPRWQPRYLVHEGRLAFPRTALSALGIEGHLPDPARAGWRRQAQRPLTARRPRT